MDLSSLRAMNEAFPLHENTGDRAYFEARLATSIAMRSAMGSVLDRNGFLDKLQSGGDRTSVSINSMTLVGKERALVSCVVATGGARYHNSRLFIRNPAAPEGWLLLAWANEPE